MVNDFAIGEECICRSTVVVRRERTTFSSGGLERSSSWIPTDQPQSMRGKTYAMDTTVSAALGRIESVTAEVSLLERKDVISRGILVSFSPSLSARCHNVHVPSALYEAIYDDEEAIAHIFPPGDAQKVLNFLNPSESLTVKV